MGYTGEAVVVPIGIDSDRYRPDDRSFQRELSASFIGSLDWIPNQEGLKWLLQEVWGPVVARHPEMVLHVAGRNPPAWVQDLAGPNVQVHGEVSDAVEFINRHSLMIVPLLAGSGMRVKILEGMALGKVVLTTSVGLEGIAATQREEALIADTPDQFAAAIEWCYGDRDRLRQIGRRARQLIRLQYDNLTTTRQLKKAYDRLLVGAS
ncbi:MAG: glycosyltransferase, partial [Saprospiraceae bacterium]|nr:glycosyltransferase [Saprospiraceae bacterium]